MKYVIVDLDGTLANVDHRVNLVRRKKKWFKKFYDLCWKDKVNEWCYTLITAMMWNRHAEVLIVSARPKSHEELTRMWIKKNLHHIENCTLYLLRKDERDFTPDVELKRDWLHKEFYGEGRDKNDILFVVDDRKRVVDMWRAEGLVCLQCSDWEEFKEK